MDQPLFEDVQDAVRFACNFNTNIVPRSSMNQMMSPSGGGNGEGGKGGLDGAGNAGIILSQIGALSLIQRCCLFARVCYKWEPCDCGSICCSKKRPNMRWHEVVTELSDEVLRRIQDRRQKGRGMADVPELRRGLIMKYFGDKLGTSDLAQHSEVNEGTVLNHRAVVWKILKTEESQAWEEVDNKLRSMNIVGYKL